MIGGVLALGQELRAKAEEEEEGEEGDGAAQGQGHSQADMQEQRDNAHTSMHHGQQVRQPAAQGEAPMDVEAPTDGHAGGQSRPHPTSAPTPSSSFGAGTAPTAPAAPTMTAGARAARRLPAVLLLVEALIEVLVEDAEGDEVEGSDHGHAGSGVPTKHGDLAVPLPAAIQQQLLDALTSVMDEMAQFLETAAEAAGFWEACAQSWDRPPPQGGQHTATAAGGVGAGQGNAQGAGSLAGDAQGVGQGGGGGAPARVPRDSRGPHTSAAAVAASMAELSLKPEAPHGEVVLGCVRVIGRFLADAPDAHTAALRKVVPFMVAAGSTGLGSSCGSEQQPPQAQGKEESAVAMAIGFLLPGLLQVRRGEQGGCTHARTHACTHARQQPVGRMWREGCMFLFKRGKVCVCACVLVVGSRCGFLQLTRSLLTGTNLSTLLVTLCHSLPAAHTPPWSRTPLLVCEATRRNMLLCDCP